MENAVAESMRLIPWWGYALTGVAGLGFGILQVWLMGRSLQDGKPKPWLFAVKLLLWAVALVGIGLISIPLVLLFAVIGSIVLLCGSFWTYCRAQKGAK